MASMTAPKNNTTDEYGIERVSKDEPGKIDEFRQKWPWFDHLMRMQERFGAMGGTQYAAGITYFSVLSMFPILMLLFAAVAFMLVNNPEALQWVRDEVDRSVSGNMGDSINKIIDTALEQRGAIAGIGGLTAMWSGLSWMNHLRYGASKMWKADPLKGNFVVRKIWDLLGLVCLLLALVVAFGITAAGSSGLTVHLLKILGLQDIPGIDVITAVVAIIVGLIANYLVFLWLLAYLPRTKVPFKSAAKGAVLGAVAFEIFKQLGSLFFSNALQNPAGATFGPIIGLMVLFYFIWMIVMYCSAWTATTERALQKADVPAPEPAVITVRHDVDETARKKRGAGYVGAGAAVGAALVGIAGLFRRKK